MSTLHATMRRYTSFLPRREWAWDQAVHRRRRGQGPRRAILVFYKKDYIPLDRSWKARAEEHHGIILADQLPLGELVRRTRLHLDTITPRQQYNAVLYLPH